MKVLFGRSKNVAYRMTSLLPGRLGAGKRNNKEKQNYVFEHLDHIEYRTIACSDEDEAKRIERELKVAQATYEFST